MNIMRWPPILVAEISWRLQRFISSLQLNNDKESLSSLESVARDLNNSTLDSLIDEEKRSLSKLLIRYPYWLAGHQAYSHLALKTNDIAAAYACAQAMLKLSNNPKVEIDANYILAKCYLRRGATNQALLLLEKVHAQCKERYDVAEDLAAAYIGAGQHDKAADVFSKIPSGSISAEGLAAKSFAESKLVQKLDLQH